MPRAKKPAAAPEAAAAAPKTRSRRAKPATAAVEASGPKTLRIYPTHRLSAGPLEIGHPSGETISVDDDGADVEEHIALANIASRDATLDAPKKD